MSLDLNKAYRWDDEFPGIAFWLWEMDEELGIGIVSMVGDDRRWEAPLEELEVLENAEFCNGCGQIGCCHGS